MRGAAGGQRRLVRSSEERGDATSPAGRPGAATQRQQALPYASESRASPIGEPSRAPQQLEPTSTGQARMNRIINSPDLVVEDAVRGYLKAHQDLVSA